jgi:hypothetical protein
MQHIRPLTLAWAGYGTLLLLLPISYLGREADLAGLSMVAWCALAFGAAFVGAQINNLTLRRLDVLNRVPTLRLVHLLVCARWSLALSVVGLLCLIVDRVLIQGIDFSRGIAVARYLWAESAESRSGVSSVYSVAGYFFGSFFFVSAAVIQLHWERIARGDRRILLTGVATLILMNSVLTGGRTVLLIALAMWMAIAALRASIGLSWFPGRFFRVITLAGTVLVFATGYVLYVFGERASAGDIPAATYSSGFATYLGGTPTRGYFEIDPLTDGLSPAAHFGVVAGMYLTHSYGTFVYILGDSDRPGSILFGYVRSLLERIGFRGVAASEWSLAGRFPSLPGALVYDFGWFGFYVGALLVGIGVGIAPLISRLDSVGGLGLACACVLVVCGILSPLLFAMDVLIMPFMILGFVANETALRLAGLRGNWLLVGSDVQFMRAADAFGKAS